MTSHGRSFKNLFINPGFQLRFMSSFVGLFVITTLSFYSTTYLFFWNLHRKAIKVGIPEDHVFHHFLAGQKYDLDMLFIGLAFFNLFLLLGIGFTISHRIAGPLKKINDHLSTPDLPEELHLREKDFFQEMVPTVNEIKKRLKK